MMVFIPLLIAEGRGRALENRLKYFLVQRAASLWFIFSCLVRAFMQWHVIAVIIVLAVTLKLGRAPFHGWFISVMTSTSFAIMFLLSTAQKFIPLLVLRTLPRRAFVVGVLVRITLGAVFSLGLVQLSVKKLLAVSSINNVRWMILGSQVSLHAWRLYLLVYSLLLIPTLITLASNHGQHISHMSLTTLPNRGKWRLVFLLLSLGGLPPFLGFFNKLLIIKVLLPTGLIILVVVIFSSLVLLYYYLSWSFFLLTNNPSRSKACRGVGSFYRVFLCVQRLTLIPVLFRIGY